MRLPYNLLTKTYTKPRMFLCETDKTRICQIETTDTQAALKFNSYSEISFEVARVYNDLITGKTIINPYYDKIEALRLIEVEDFGFFQIQGPGLSSDGIKESKQITAYSFEYTLSQTYLEDLYNDGTVGSVEAGYIDEVYGGTLPERTEYPVVILYDKTADIPGNEAKKKLSLLHIILEDVYGWEIGYIDDSIATKSRQFNVDRTSVYDFIMNDICEMFNCYATFDIGKFGEKNKINLYAEASTQRFKCEDDNITEFILNPKYQKIGTVSDSGYKTTNYTYDAKTGKLVLDKAPAKGNIVEVIGADLTEWETDVFISFDNLSKEVTVDYDADSIKTVLNVEYGEGQNIREVNLGLPFITDLSYYNTPEWMGQELYDAYGEYNKTCQEKQKQYTRNVQERLELATKLDYEENRVSLSYSIVHDVDHTTVTDEDNGKVYYVRTGDFPNYTYVEKKLPDEYKAGTTYFKIGGNDLTENKIVDFRKALGVYFRDDSMEELDKLVEAETFNFTNDTSSYKGLPFGDKLYKEGTLLFILNKYKSCGALKSDAKDRNPEDLYENMEIDTENAQIRDAAIKQFLGEILDQFGTNMLGVIKDMYVKAQEGFIEGWNKAKDANIDVEEDTSTDDDKEMTEEDREEIEKEIQDSAKDYPNYYPIILILEVLNEELGVSIYDNPPATKSTGRYEKIDPLKKQIDELIAANTTITQDLNMGTWFKKNYPNNYEALLIRLSPFLREDELVLDDIVSSELDTIVESLNIQEDALSAAHIELEKLSRPQLNFSMTMANIYALPEFAPIIEQFKLGNLIKVAIRPDLIKQSRLMQVNIGLDDFSNFSCEFGELTSLRSQSDIHADLLSQAVSAGKQVATYSSYWTKGSDVATSTDLKIQQGLLDATTAIKSIDGTQDIIIDKYGIHLQKKDPGTGVVHPEQAKFVNNSLLFTKDGWKTSTTGLGKFTIGNKDFYGLIAEAVLSGYIEGTDIVGGTLRIGDLGNNHWALEVDKYGTVSMLGGYITFSSNGDGTFNNSLKDTIDNVQTQITEINDKNKYSVEVISDGPIIITSSEDTTTLTCKVYNWDTDITDTLSDELFRWYRTSNNTVQDGIWNSSQKGYHTKTITINHEDTEDDGSTSFYCEVDLLPDED